jgi:hypothetical protein
MVVWKRSVMMAASVGDYTVLMHLKEETESTSHEPEVPSQQVEK